MFGRLNKILYVCIHNRMSHPNFSISRDKTFDSVSTTKSLNIPSIDSSDPAPQGNIGYDESSKNLYLGIGNQWEPVNGNSLVYSGVVSLNDGTLVGPSGDNKLLSTEVSTIINRDVVSFDTGEISLPTPGTYRITVGYSFEITGGLPITVTVEFLGPGTQVFIQPLKYLFSDDSTVSGIFEFTVVSEDPIAKVSPVVGLDGVGDLIIPGQLVVLSIWKIK